MKQQSIRLFFLVLLLALPVTTACSSQPASNTAPTAPAVSPTQSGAQPTTSAPSANSGSLTVAGVQFQVASATRQNTYLVGTKTYKPSTTQDECLLVEAQLLSGDTGKVSDWTVSVIDEKRRASNASYASTISGGSTQGGKQRWLFYVAKTSQSFVLNLPDQQAFKLDSLLKK
jgi:hypothetical protein